jgi:uncharacterized membrane protein
MEKRSSGRILLDVIFGVISGELLFLGALILILIVGPGVLFHFVLGLPTILSIILNVIYLALLITLIVFLVIKLRKRRKEKKRKELEEKVALKIWLDKNKYPEKYEPKEEEFDQDFKEFMSSRGPEESLPKMAPTLAETPEDYYKKRWK